ncbi:PcfJ domain-containing protein [Butyrivibrio fibrisolvens]|uniref:PcfJ domain-containing protein n=1 Tax=Butyrivibrio fibrisolvens TaxID=831 RepID=UPI0003B71131|nr:PcfJ domain-containing protein [Butyrivibrio fibrisolvens]
MKKSILKAMNPLKLSRNEKALLKKDNKAYIKAGIISDGLGDLLELDLYKGLVLYKRYFIDSNHSWFGITNENKITKSVIYDWLISYLNKSDQIEKDFLNGATLREIQEAERKEKAKKREEERAKEVNKYLCYLKPLSRSQKTFLYKKAFDDQEFALVNGDIARCTYCNKDFSSNGLKHLAKLKCPCCGTTITIRKRKVANQFITAIIPYTNKGRLIVEYYSVQRAFNDQDIKVSACRQAIQVSDDTSYHQFIRTRNYENDYVWKDVEEIRYYGMARNVFFPKKSRIYRNFSLSNTRFKYITPKSILEDYVEKHDYSWLDFNYYLNLAAKDKIYEYFLRMKWKKMIAANLSYYCYRIKYDNSKSTIYDILKISKNQFNTLPKDPEPMLIEYLQRANEYTSSYLKQIEVPNNTGAYDIALMDATLYAKKPNSSFSISVDELRALIKIKGDISNYCYMRLFVSAHKIFRYIKSNHDLGIWKDYLKMQYKLGFRKSEINLFPKNLQKEHDNSAELLKIETDRKNNEILNKLAKTLASKYNFESDGFVIVIPHSIQDFKDEKAQMHNCVTNYIDDVCNLQTVVLFVRRTSDPSKSLCTMEVKNGIITQLYAARNKEAPEDVTKVIYGKFAKEKHLMIA